MDKCAALSVDMLRTMVQMPSQSPDTLGYALNLAFPRHAMFLFCSYFSPML